MVELQPMQERHFEQTHAWLTGSAELRAQIDSLDVPTPEGNRAYWRRNLQDGTREDFAIVAGGKRHIGNCGLVAINKHRSEVELWIYLGEGRQGGLGGKALKFLLDRAFGPLGLKRVSLRVVASNVRVVSFYERAGFTVEGRARGETVQDGKTVDSILMSVLATERAE